MSQVIVVVFAALLIPTISTQQLTLGNVICQIQNSTRLQRNLELRLSRREVYIYVCESCAQLDKTGSSYCDSPSSCEQLQCTIQGIMQPLSPRVSVVDVSNASSDTLPRAHILIATILALAFVVSAMGLFIWVRRTGRANVCCAHAHSSSPTPHLEPSITDDDLDDEENVDPLPSSRIAPRVTSIIEMREKDGHISRDLRQESIAEEQE